jgi:hypothetical protein
MRYRTEISIPADRYVCVQLPSYLPEGLAVLTVTIQAPIPIESSESGETDPDRMDIEWWDEFEGDPASVV